MIIAVLTAANSSCTPRSFPPSALVSIHSTSTSGQSFPISGLESFTLPTQIHILDSSDRLLMGYKRLWTKRSSYVNPPVSGTVRSDDNGNLYIAILSSRPGLALHPVASSLAVESLKVPHDWCRIPHRVFPSLPQGEPTTTPPAFAPLSSSAASGLDRFLAPYKATRWRNFKNALATLKADLSPPVISCQWISSGNAVTSLVFGAKIKTETLVLPYRTRYRLPEAKEDLEGQHDGGNYFGNLYNLCRSTVADLLSSAVEEGAARDAFAIRADLNAQLTPEAITNQIAFFKDNRATRSPDIEIASTADFLVSNLCRLDLQGSELNFGWENSFNYRYLSRWR
ncbi:hypothetical protein BDB00DRAFT_866627 [Zychaea mexicana]|uniref:uncharacterized protein n=1 Tax=Zychaea mexicana TaxID=64656 RepID=UPI0022FEC7B4|nr:uncharacterized protein BDB00DRAFT_866627 [Zychaea mexicana]KAI9499138.1 hypothetical protein BDB00DRAFT_866627 [Zychaea mexicana]